MPDQKTTYSSDDGTNTAFWKFVSDEPADMSVGTLYGAKFKQVGAQPSPRSNIQIRQILYPVDLLDP